MAEKPAPALRLLIIVTPNFNLLATVGVIDPLRAANYLDGFARFRWTFASPGGGMTVASNGLSIDTRALTEVASEPFDMVVVSTSWAPEAHVSPQFVAVLHRLARAGSAIGAIDTGAFVLAEAAAKTMMRAPSDAPVQIAPRAPFGRRLDLDQFTAHEPVRYSPTGSVPPRQGAAVLRREAPGPGPGGSQTSRR